ncbi:MULTISPECIES: hypothetical protein [Sorangium]|uniref:Uncharacterized protein n=1 Tax=Sorangium cellulosum TaxID=56 RepID=A0A4P2R1R1_SORCE|nr:MULTISPECIES: hypothetical protein [Sorangium]AUX36805.1 uncharacterized protein SOCE836_090220 [Sorangium cellulosum]WCQ96101.1 hypothetical protein NQZ70_08885 [Sorangium sp. Soce836]
MNQQNQHSEPGTAEALQKSVERPPGIVMELDPGMKYIVRASVAGTWTLLGEITSLSVGGITKEYFVLSAALPAGATSIKISAKAATTAPTSPTFQINAVQFGSAASPAASSTLFVNTTSHIGLVWGFTNSGGVWSGSATWYHGSAGFIQIPAGGVVTLNNNTADQQLTFRAINTAP